jgi:predicted DNA-binding protein
LKRVRNSLQDIKTDKMTNKKWAVKRITVNLAAQEADRLEQYCQQTGRPATDVIRELIRGLSASDDASKAV